MQGKVLIVDDDPLVSESLQLMINEIGEYIAETSADPFDALKKLHENNFHIVFTDVIMPGMNGIDFLRRVKQYNPNLPVVMITGYPTVELAVEAMKEGAADFIKKPFQIDSIQRLIKLLMETQKNTNLTENKSGITSEKLRELQHTLSEKTFEISLLHAMNESFYNTQSDHDIHSIYNLIVKTACLVSASDYSFLLVYDIDAREFMPSAAYGRPIETCESISADLAYEILHNKEYAFRRDYFINLSKNLKSDRSGNGILLPVVIQQQLYGILEVGRHDFWKNFSLEDIMLLRNLARKASLSIENKLLCQSVYTNIQNILNTLVAVIGARDHYTLTHSMRVTEYALQIGQALGCDSDELEMLNFAGHLHDIGKIGISDLILLKPGTLSEQEYRVVRQHPVIGENILKPLGYLPRERDIIRYHHERWDGKGYPDGLQGEDIPYLSRILAIADSFDAMTTDRPYRKALPMSEALNELKRNRSQFDQNIVAVFIDILGGSTYKTKVSFNPFCFS